MATDEKPNQSTPRFSPRDRWHWFLYRCATGHAVAAELALSEKRQYLPRDELQAFQLNRLKQTLEHAASHVPYYRDLFHKIGFSASDLRSVADLAGLPPLERDTVRDRVDELIADDTIRARLHMGRTAATTGMPLRVFSDQEAMKMGAVRSWRAHGAWGYRPGDRILQLLRIPGRDSWSMPIRDWFRALLARDKRIDVTDCSRAGLAKVVAKIEAWRPTFLRAYIAVLNLLAAWLEHEGRRLDVPCVIGGAELMTDGDRQRFKDRIGADVLDFYSAHEAPGLAFECTAHEGLHLSIDDFVVEIVAGDRPARPGEVGEVLLTTLTNRAMPMIRYRLGDTLTPLDTPCSCRRTLPLARMTHGRLLNIISAPDGRHLPPYVFLQMFRRLGQDTIAKFQIVQEEIDRLQIRLVRKPAFSETTERTLREAVRGEMGETVRIEFDFVEDIELTPRGKQRIIQSSVPVQFGRNPGGDPPT